MNALDWRPIIDGRIESNDDTVLVLMPRGGPSGRIQGCRLREGKPFVIGSIFAFDYGDERPTHWAPYPMDLPK